MNYYKAFAKDKWNQTGINKYKFFDNDFNEPVFVLSGAFTKPELKALYDALEMNNGENFRFENSEESK